MADVTTNEKETEICERLVGTVETEQLADMATNEKATEICEKLVVFFKTEQLADVQVATNEDVTEKEDSTVNEKSTKKNQKKKASEKSVKEVVTEQAGVVAYKNNFSCKKCDFLFSTQRQLYRHTETYHVEDSQVPMNQGSKVVEVREKVPETVGESESKMEKVEPGNKTDSNSHVIKTIKKSQPKKCSSKTSPDQGQKVVIQCQRCDQDFTSEETFVTHMKSHDMKVKTLYRCQECERTFDQTQALAEHKTRHQNETIECTSVCPLCDMIFRTQKGMKIHLMKIHKHWKCLYCLQVLSTDIFQTHLLTHVTDTVSKMDIEEMNQTVLKSNVESEESYLKRQKLRALHHCPYCDFSFTIFKSLNAHLGKVHRFSKCRPCNLIIPLDKVQEHMDSDTHKTDKVVDKTFKCTECELEFSNFQKLYYHRKRRHMFKCPECVKMFLPTLETYKEHLESHGIKFKETKTPENHCLDHVCQECGRSFQTRKGLVLHQRNMLKPKPRWQKIIFRCDPVYERCKFCNKTFKSNNAKHLGGVCPEKLKQEWEKNLSQMKIAIEAAVLKANMGRKDAALEKRTIRQKMKEHMGLFGYTVMRGKCKQFQCKHCRSIFYHKDGYDYHLRRRCAAVPYRRVSGFEVKECRVLVKLMQLPEILQHTGHKFPSILIGKKVPRLVKCFCCKDKVCKNLMHINKELARQMDMQNKFASNRQDNELNEEKILQALDIKVEEEFLSDHTYCNSSLLRRKNKPEVVLYTENEFDYQRRLESAMESIKQQFEIFNNMAENDYIYYSKTWPKAGREFCFLEAAKKPLQEQIWSYTCHQTPVPMNHIKDNVDNCQDKEFVWNIKCNSTSAPPFVDETIKIFQNFFDSWKVLVDPFLSKQEVINFDREVITIDIRADSSTNLFVLITFCNENNSIEKAFGYYFSCVNVPNNIKSVTYKNIETDKNGKTAFKTTLIFGNKPTDEIVCGIKINMEDFDFIHKLGGFQLMSQKIGNYLQPDLNFTLIEFGCKNGFLSASLAEKYERVISFDESLEIDTGKRLCNYNGITNVTYVEATSTSITSVIESVTNEQLHVVVNTDAQWITNQPLMRQLRTLNHLKSIVVVTTYSPNVYLLPISELITADPSFFGYSFIPIRSFVVQKASDKSQFQIVMLLLREDVYEQKPIKTEPVEVLSMIETDTL